MRSAAEGLRLPILPPVQGVAAPAAPAPLLRPARRSDVGAMASLINGWAARGAMLPRSPADLCRAFRDYVVAADGEGRVAACGGLRLYTPALGEVVGLAVDEARRGEGLGAAVVTRLLDHARALRLERVFALTLEPAFFGRLGFRTVVRTGIPEKVASDCRGCARREGCREVAVLLELADESIPPL